MPDTSIKRPKSPDKLTTSVRPLGVALTESELGQATGASSSKVEIAVGI